MNISNFSSLIELAAGLNIAFVAVEYAKDYTLLLSKKVFDFPSMINKAFKTCDSDLSDKESLDHIKPVELNGKSTFTQIEEAKIKHEKLSTHIKTEKERLNDEVSNICAAKSFSSLSLWMFLFCVVLLLVCGSEVGVNNFQYIFISLLGVFTITYLSFGWIIGEVKVKKLKYLDYSSLKHCMYWFITCIFLSLVGGYAINANFNLLFISNIVYENGLILSLLLLPFLNFIIYYYLIKRKTQIIKKIINDSVSQISKECKDFHTMVDSLLTVNKIEVMLTGEDEKKVTH